MDCKLVTREANWEVLPVVQVGNEVDLHESGSGESGFKRCLAWRIILLVFLMAGSFIQVCRESLLGGQEKKPPLPCGYHSQWQSGPLPRGLFELCFIMTWRVNISPCLSSERSRTEP